VAHPHPLGDEPPQALVGGGWDGGTVQRIESNTNGMKVVISASLKGPNETSRRFCTVWLIPDSSLQPRLITAFPE